MRRKTKNWGNETQDKKKWGDEMQDKKYPEWLKNIPSG